MSEKNTLDQLDFKKIAMTLAFSGASAIVATLIVMVGDMDFGSYAFLIPLVNTLLYGAKKFLEGKS